MGEIQVRALDGEHFDVEVSEGDIHTRHHVVLRQQFIDDLGLHDIDRARIVHEAFDFLLEREPATSILGNFGIDRIPSYFADFSGHLRRRLGCS